MDKLDTRDGRRDGAPELPTGLLMHRVALGTEATYRIVGENDQGVEVEVVEAPGLEPNTRFTFATADVIQMTDTQGRRADRARRANHAALFGAAKRRYA